MAFFTSVIGLVDVFRLSGASEQSGIAQCGDKVGYLILQVLQILLILHTGPPNSHL